MVIHKRCRKLPLKPHNLFCPPRFHFVCSSGQVFIVAIRPLPAFLRLPQDQKPIALKVFSSSFPKLNGPLLFRKCSVICFCHLSGLFPKKKKSLAIWYENVVCRPVNRNLENRILGRTYRNQFSEVARTTSR